MDSSKALVTFCTTCRGRLWQLGQTLPVNLTTCRDDPFVRFVVLDYNSEDGTADWVRSNDTVMSAIHAGRLMFVRERTAPHYHSPRAKNLAHRFGQGIVCNLDADNYAVHLAETCRSAVAEQNRVMHAYIGLEGSRNGSHGRIALRKEWFLRVGGYNEALLPMAFQDNDLLNRLRAIGYGITVPDRPWPALPIPNDPSSKTELTGTNLSLEAMDAKNIRVPAENIRRGRLAANLDGWGAGEVSVNFGQYHRLDPIIPAAASTG